MDPDNPLIQKKIVHAGKEFKPFQQGSKVYFHFTTRKCDKDNTLIDDSRKMGKPMELVLGKNFKLEVWEAIVQTMNLLEVANFKIDKCLVASYPFISKTLRESLKPAEHRNHHCCGVTIQNEGIGYDDLNQMLKEPTDLEFTIELLNVESPDEYKKEAWQMNEGEKLAVVPRLREEGNQLFRSGLDCKAADKYAEALGILEQLMMKEKPGDTEWKELEQQKLPLLLNFSQCKLNNGEFYVVIEHCTTVLNIDPDNVKALFRRGRAHLGAWNPKEARQDFQRAVELQPSLAASTSAELRKLEKEERKRNAEDRAKLAGKLF